MREIAWGVDSEKSLQVIASELSKDREVVEDEDGCLHTYDVLGIGIAFQVKDQVEFTDEPPVFNFRNHKIGETKLWSLPRRFAQGLTV